MNDYVALLLGVLSAGLGGELFVRGTVGLAQWARIPQGIIGATVAGFATSSPELSISINSALAGKPQIALGDALGSNIMNIALVLAVALLISGIQSSREAIKRDFFVALVIPVITGFLLFDDELSRVDGLLMLSLFLAWLVATIVEARKQRNATEEILGEHHRGWPIVLACSFGLTFLVVAGILIVRGAKGIAIDFGIDEFTIGATVVAVGSSMPELATAVIAKLRGQDEVGIGTLLGSNIFNGVFIIAVAAIIHPINVAWNEAINALLFGLVAVMLIYPSKTGFIKRSRGVILLMLYALYLATIFQLKAVNDLL
jgi:cation:H+ antiporter